MVLYSSSKAAWKLWFLHTRHPADCHHVTESPNCQKRKSPHLPSTTPTDLARATHEPIGVDGFALVFAGRVPCSGHRHVITTLALSGQG